MIVGGWKLVEFKECSLPAEVKEAFDKVYGERLGATYTPVLYCGEQIVSGKNYMIICGVDYATEEEKKELVKIVIYKDLQGNCKETESQKLA